MTVLVTGAAGFIGSHVVEGLLRRCVRVVGLDNHNDYYDVSLKEARVNRTSSSANYSHIRAAIEDRAALDSLFAAHRPRKVVHLAAQAGVRYAAINPHSYGTSNLIGMLNVLECCRNFEVEHLVFASTSSVYGASRKLPFSEDQCTDHPLTLYAATKKANEAMAHSYAHLYGIPTTGLRFFTVYGPWGRPDMAPMKFAKAIAAGTPIQVFNYGKHSRSFTFIDDIVEGILRTLDQNASMAANWDETSPRSAESGVAPYRVYNIGHEQPVQLLDFIRELEKQFDRKAVLEMHPLQPGDVLDTEADVSSLISAVGYRPPTRMEDGVARFVSWYRQFYRV